MSALECLDLLVSELPRRNHVWTLKQRKAYERLVRELKR